MFNPKIVAQIAKANQERLKVLATVEDRLRTRFYDFEEPIRALILSVASGEPLLLIGPPGTAKSRLIRAFCGTIGLLDEDDLSKNHEDYFEYLLTPFTEPGELFGYYDLSKASRGELTRIEVNMMQMARVVYLDEVFNGSSAILNSILAFLNERIFHDRGVRKKVKMECLFAASNQVPETPELRAIFDRFVLRCYVDNVAASPEPLGKLLESGWIETFSTSRRAGQNLKEGGLNLLAEMEKMRGQIRARTQSGEMIPKGSNNHLPGELARLVEHARTYELSAMSNRRLVKILHVMLIHRIYEAVRSGNIGSELSIRNKEELSLIPRFFLDRFDDEEAISRMEGFTANARS
jgi:MoxR-like ATPase